MDSASSPTLNKPRSRNSMLVLATFTRSVRLPRRTMTPKFGAVHGAPKGPKKGNHMMPQQKRGSHNYTIPGSPPCFCQWPAAFARLFTTNPYMRSSQEVVDSYQVDTRFDQVLPGRLFVLY